MPRKALTLARQLYDRAAPADRCPHLVGPAMRGLPVELDPCHCNALPSHAADVCGTASLQLWCLAGPLRWPKCVYFPKPKPAE